MKRLEELMEKQRQLEKSVKADSVIEKSMVEQVQDNLTIVKALRAGIEQSRASVQKENLHLQYDVYRPKIRALEDERDQLVQGNMAAHETEQAQKEKEIDGLYVVVNHVKRILDFLRLKRVEDLAINDDDVEVYRDRAKENLGYIFDDDYLKIKLFIAENDKPKNKFSLIAAGRTIFPEHLLKLTYGYGACINTRLRYQLITVLREAPSVEELRAWLQKLSQSELLTGLKGDYEEVKAAYLAILEQYQVEDFLELMTDRCTCGNFITIFDSYAFRENILDCGHCGQKMEKLIQDQRDSV